MFNEQMINPKFEIVLFMIQNCENKVEVEAIQDKRRKRQKDPLKVNSYLINQISKSYQIPIFVIDLLDSCLFLFLKSNLVYSLILNFF